MRLLLDANVIFSAAWSSDGYVAGLVRLAEAGQVELLVSPHGVEEARRNLALKRPEAIPTLAAILRIAELVREAAPELVAETAERHRLPPNDAPILAAAIEAAVDGLITGDSTHFGHLYDLLDMHPTVLRPQDAMRLVLETEAP